MRGPFETIEIPLFGGPDEKTGRLVRGPGIIRAALNADHRQAGYVRKRRGYERVDLARVVNVAEDAEDKFHALATLRGALVIVGSDYVYELSSLSGSLTAEHTTATISRRGPTVRGGFAIQHVTSSSLRGEL